MARDTGIVTIHGKEYETVASRVKKFRDKYGEDYSILTEVLERDEKTVVVKASICKGDLVLANGHAEEDRQDGSINKTSAVENCETSAIGRALAAFGMGGTEYATADELVTAISRQSHNDGPSRFSNGMATEKQRELVSKLLTDRGIAKEEQKGYLIEQYGVEVPLTKEGASFVIEELKATKQTITA